ncbi:BirA family biotin operon repressor/biotin-[acetyl-CoA-carboxylase] ligase [Acinetobacter calcoaceticus]|uniref:BirA family biotin operon repressor/biotin-[acetyl-CoA-carboxylase] ligase n=1 Tax=Acinetobacter calcoaceticus TaxID=471 RepID=A0A4R1XWG6_ACICA|nr:BirA family biotin operon repressor/biotin-[acetyl-CoA-carboxylase] ligase [Acinetobacter calcoaceticus]
MDVETRQLRQLLNDVQQLPEALLLKHSTTSTNDDVRELARNGLKTILVCSEQQTQGRGQRLRQWVSPKGNIYLSTILDTRKALDGRLALEIALNILQMPSLKPLQKLQIKWPNDLYSPDGKWGGILVEPISPQQAIIGVGLNLMPFSAQQLADQPIDQPATSLAQLGLQHPQRIELISELYLAIQQAGRWFDHGCYNLAARFNHCAAFMDQQVEFEQIHQTINGIFRGIADDGSVGIETNSAISQYYQGRLRQFNPLTEQHA